MVREEGNFNVGRRERHDSPVCWKRREKDVRENDGARGREMVVENEGKLSAEVRERKVEFEESASDDEEGASIGEGSSVGRNTARVGWGEGRRNGALARARGLETTLHRVPTARLAPEFVRYGSTTVIVSKCKSEASEREREKKKRDRVRGWEVDGGG